VIRTYYIAGSVRSIGRERAIHIRQETEEYLLSLGGTCFNPPGAWTGNPNNESSEAFIKVANDAILTMCSDLAVVFFGGMNSRGTEAEIALAARLGKRITVFVRSDDELSSAVAYVSLVVAEVEFQETVTIVFKTLPSAKVQREHTVEYDKRR